MSNRSVAGDEEQGEVVNHRDVDVDVDEVSAQAQGRFEHRLSLPYRASRNNAAQSNFKKSSALVYHYLDKDPDSVILGEFGGLEQITLLCGFCNRSGNARMKGWNYNARARGSTTNYSNHMQNHHKRAWDEILQLDRAAINGQDAPENAAGPIQQWLSEKVCRPFILNVLLLIVNIDVQNRRLLRQIGSILYTWQHTFLGNGARRVHRCIGLWAPAVTESYRWRGSNED